MKTNLVILCAEDAFKDVIGKKLSNRLDMIYVDVAGIVDYELIDSEKMIEQAGEDYFKKQRDSIIKRIFNFENSIIVVGADLLRESAGIDKIKEHSVFLFLKLNFESFIKLQNKSKASKDLKKINQTVFEERQKYFEGFSDITIDISNKNNREILESIESAINNYFN